MPVRPTRPVPTRPVPTRAKEPGSGTATLRLVLPLESFGLPSNSLAPGLICVVATVLPYAINDDPVRDNPRELTEITSRAAASMLVAKAANGTARVTTARHTSFLDTDLPPPWKVPNQGQTLFSEDAILFSRVCLPVDDAAFRNCHKVRHGVDTIDSVLSRSCNWTYIRRGCAENLKRDRAGPGLARAANHVQQSRVAENGCWKHTRLPSLEEVSP